MNKRIKELIVLPTTCKQHTGPFGIQQVTEQFNKEKFAELIVKECIKIVEDSRIQGDEGVCLGVSIEKYKESREFRPRKPDSFVKNAYRGWKEKFCIRIKVVDSKQIDPDTTYEF